MNRISIKCSSLCKKMLGFKFQGRGQNQIMALSSKIFFFWKFFFPETFWVEHRKRRLLNMITIYVMNEGSVLDNAKRFCCLQICWVLWHSYIFAFFASAVRAKKVPFEPLLRLLKPFSSVFHSSSPSSQQNFTQSIHINSPSNLFSHRFAIRFLLLSSA